MYLSLLTLEARSAEVQRDLRDPQALHRTVMRAFPDVLDPEVGARAHLGVLHRLEFERRTGRLLLYVQSEVAPDWRILPAGYLAPGGDRVKPVASTYQALQPGRILRFRLRANPTRKIDTKSGPNGEKRNGRRVPINGEKAQIDWLVRKGEENGFELLQALVTGTGAGELVRSHSTQRTFQGVLYEGRIRVVDPVKLREGLAQGVGPAKAFGFGLLSVGPA